MPVVLATELKNQFIKGDAKGYVSQNLFFSAHHSLFVCHSSQPQEEKKEFLENNAQKKERERDRERARQQRCSDWQRRGSVPGPLRVCAAAPGGYLGLSCT